MTETAPVPGSAPEGLAARLAAVVGAEHVVTDPAVAASYGRDLTGRFTGQPLLVVSPADARQVAGVLGACAAAGVAVVPQGGHSGLVGGGTPRDGELVLSLRRLTEIEEVDPTARQVTVGAGVTLERLQARARELGLDFPVDHGARSSATIGGMVATNAGGALAARHGMMRAHVVGVEAVLADGSTITRLSGLLKDNTGYDLTGLLVGSEGTLAVVTRARLRLGRLLRQRVSALVGVDDLGGALEVLELLGRSVPSLQAVDFFELAGLRRVCAQLGLPQPFEREHGVYLALDCAGDSDPTDELAGLVDLVGDAVAASDEEGRRRLWLYREAHNETVNALGVPHKLDVTVPLRSLPDFARDVRVAVRAVEPDAEVLLYGHLGDGNVHVNVLGPPLDDPRVDRAVLELVARHGGSVSAEHGIGLAKAEWLGLTRSAAEIAAMRAVKNALDPHGLLSPGRLLTLEPAPR